MGNLNGYFNIRYLANQMQCPCILIPFIFKKIKPLNIPVSTLARGVAIGGELAYADEVTLGRSIVNRVPYDHELVK